MILVRHLYSSGATIDPKCSSSQGLNVALGPFLFVFFDVNFFAALRFVFDGPYPSSLASVVRFESEGKEMILQRAAGQRGSAWEPDIYGPVAIPPMGFLAPGCNILTFTTMVDDAALSANIPLHLYDVIVYVAPKSSSDLCDWSRLAGTQETLNTIL